MKELVENVKHNVQMDYIQLMELVKNVMQTQNTAQLKENVFVLLVLKNNMSMEWKYASLKLIQNVQMENISIQPQTAVFNAKLYAINVKIRLELVLNVLFQD